MQHIHTCILAVRIFMKSLQHLHIALWLVLIITYICVLNCNKNSSDDCLLKCIQFKMEKCIQLFFPPTWFVTFSLTAVYFQILSALYHLSFCLNTVYILWHPCWAVVCWRCFVLPLEGPIITSALFNFIHCAELQHSSLSLQCSRGSFATVRNAAYTTLVWFTRYLKMQFILTSCSSMSSDLLIRVNIVN